MKTKLDAEIVELEQRLSAVQAYDLGRPPLLNNLAVRLRARFGVTSDPSDLERAVVACRNAVAFADLASPDAATYLNTLGTCLSDRFALIRSAEDLDAAIAAFERAVDRSATSPDAPAFEANLAGALADRYRRDGAPEDLDRAIKIVQRRLADGAFEVAERAGLAANCVSMLQDRYAATGVLDDLERAVLVARTALAACPPGAFGRTVLLTNLGGALQSRYEHANHREDLDAALDAFAAGLAETITSAPNRVLLLNNLGLALAARAKVNGVPWVVGDLAESVAVHRSAVRAAPPADRLLYLNNLAAALSDRYQARGRSRDLSEALRIWRRSVRGTPPEAPRYARRLGNVARGFALRYDRRCRRRDGSRARKSYRESCLAGLASDPEAALAAGSEWGRWAVRRKVYPEAREAYDLAAAALDQLFRVQLVRPHKEAWLRVASGAASAGAFAHAMAGDRPGAVLAIERGRAMMLSEALERDRAELTRLHILGRGDLAGRYTEATRRLEGLPTPHRPAS